VRSFAAVLGALLLVFGCARGFAETFLITSDLHLTEDSAAHEAALEALRSASEGADAVILLGDSVNNARPEEHARVTAFLASLDAPCYVIPGNHDVTTDISAFTELYADFGWNDAFSRDGGSASCAVITAGGACLLLLDTNDVTGGVAPLGGISEATCAWVSETLAALPEGTPVIACGHHPLLPAERQARTPGAQALVAALQGVKLYLCGHDHGFATVRARGLQQITTGQPHAYPGWAGLLEVDPDGFHWRVVPLYDDETQQAMRAETLTLADSMARGTLKGTPFEDDEEAIRWFTEAFDAAMSSRLDEETCRAMLDRPAAQKWRMVETKTVVKSWILGLLEGCPQDVRQIDIE